MNNWKPTFAHPCIRQASPPASGTWGSHRPSTCPCFPPRSCTHHSVAQVQHPQIGGGVSVTLDVFSSVGEHTLRHYCSSESMSVLKLPSNLSDTSQLGWILFLEIPVMSCVSLFISTSVRLCSFIQYVPSGIGYFAYSLFVVLSVLAILETKQYIILFCFYPTGGNIQQINKYL